jgi:hypothetical protein
MHYSTSVRDGADLKKNPITYIVNLSITFGIVPDDMIIARIKPLYKIGSSLDVGNYRPCSQVPVRFLRFYL